MVEYVGPLGSDRPRKIKVDPATDEYVAEVVRLPMNAIWSDLPEPAPFEVYPVEEIGAEKLRCIIQRVQCRDLYDLYRSTEDVGVHLRSIRPLFEAKCRAKSIDAGTFGDRFADRVGRYRPRWTTEMSEHIAEIPRFDAWSGSCDAPCVNPVISATENRRAASRACNNPDARESGATHR